MSDGEVEAEGEDEETQEEDESEEQLPADLVPPLQHTLSLLFSRFRLFCRLRSLEQHHNTRKTLLINEKKTFCLTESFVSNSSMLVDPCLTAPEYLEES